MQHNVDADLSKKFKNYIDNVLGPAVNEDERRYLSKNNNNILRMDYLQKTFPEAHIIVPFPRSAAAIHILAKSTSPFLPNAYNRSVLLKLYELAGAF